MSAGRPVIAYRGGGALDTVIQGKTGEYFDVQTPESLNLAIQQFDPYAYDPIDCRAQAETFSQEEFRRRVLDSIEELVIQGIG